MKPKTNPVAQPVPTFNSLEDFEAEMSVTAEVTVNGKKLRVQGRRLRPCESRRLKPILNEILPPRVPGKKLPDGTETPETYDLSNPAYLAAKDQGWRRARALGLWLAYPMFRERWNHAHNPGLPEPEDSMIVEFFEDGALEEDVLDALFEALTRKRVSLEELANFTSAAVS